MARDIAIVFVFVLLFSCIFPASATTCGNATFSTLGQGGSEDILIYSFDGENQTLLGQWNTSSPDVPMPCGDYNIVVRPSAQNRFNDPTLFLSDIIDFATTNAIPLVFLVFLLGYLLTRR